MEVPVDSAALAPTRTPAKGSRMALQAARAARLSQGHSPWGRDSTSVDAALEASRVTPAHSQGRSTNHRGRRVPSLQLEARQGQAPQSPRAVHQYFAAQGRAAVRAQGHTSGGGARCQHGSSGTGAPGAQPRAAAGSSAAPAPLNASVAPAPLSQLAAASAGARAEECLNAPEVAHSLRQQRARLFAALSREVAQAQHQAAERAKAHTVVLQGCRDEQNVARTRAEHQGENGVNERSRKNAEAMRARRARRAPAPSAVAVPAAAAPAAASGAAARLSRAAAPSTLAAPPSPIAAAAPTPSPLVAPQLAAGSGITMGPWTCPHCEDGGTFMTPPVPTVRCLPN